MVQGLCAPPCRALPSIFALLKLLPCQYRVSALNLSCTSIGQGTLFCPHQHSSLRPTCISFFSAAAKASSVVQAFSSLKPSIASSDDTFFADGGVTWKSLGLSQDIVDALERAQLYRPSAVQAAAVPSILADGDVVMAAETGSGKTQAYLAPLFNKLLETKQTQIDAVGSQTLVERGSLERQIFALVLCPNAMLCEQVMQMANTLCDSLGTPLLKVSVVSGGQGWPISPPKVVVATPAALLNHLFAYDPKRKRRIAFVRDCKYVVFDEADMLLSGGFENQVMRLLNMFRLEEKQLSKSESGRGTIERVDFRPWTDFEPTEPTAEDVDDAKDKEENPDSHDEDEEADSSDDEADGKSNTKQSKHKDWLRSRKVYTRSKQYIFAAATLPENGKKTPGAVLKRILPDAKYVNGLFLHRQNPKLREKWVEVDGTTQVEALLNALSDAASSGKENLPNKTLVFANSVEAADAICKILRRAEVECSCYHREIPSEERMSTLKTFQDRGGILVCTDAAARGLDIHNVSHVIQAEFAKSAIDFLHRVGRTARAGHSGAVTSLYTKANRALVEAVRQAEAASHSVEGAFSRKRSFRNKVKKSELVSQLEE